MLITTLVIACIAITAPIWAIEAKRKAREDLADRHDLETPWGEVIQVPYDFHDTATTPEG